MKPLFIAGNWKSNKTIIEASEWLKKFTILVEQGQQLTSMTVLIGASNLTLSSLSRQLDSLSLPLKLAAQNISQFSEGAYTGEVSGRMLKEVVSWVIIGHSERRKYFNETEEILAHKVSQAKQAGLGVIYCVPDDRTIIPSGVDVIGYEPVWAIGTGKTDTPENANQVIANIKTATNVATVVYGGSITDASVHSFVEKPSIDGVLVGAASLDPEKFYRILVGAATASQ